jgi:hypothetical protein
MRKELPAYPPKKRTSSPTTQLACPQRGQGLLLVLSIFFQVGFSMIVRIELYYNLSKRNVYIPQLEA